MTYTLQDLNYDRSAESIVAGFIAVTPMPRRFEARRDACDELADILMDVHKWDIDRAADFAHEKLRAEGWTFYPKGRLTRFD